MRQAGRWDPEFRKLRAGRTFFEFSENAELAAAASLCPLRFGVDAVILFYDITTLAIAMGQPFQLVAERGPVPDHPVRTLADVDRLTTQPSGPAFDAVLKTLDIVRRSIPATIAPLVFAGAPFTLATYQIGTGKHIDQTRQFIRDQPEVWRRLLRKTTEATVTFLRTVTQAGAAAYQLFDSWAGELTPDEYNEFAHPFHQEIFTAVGGLSILFVKDAPDVGLMTKSGAKILSLGVGHDLAGLRSQFPDMVFQGNVDHQLLVHGSAEEVGAATRRCLAAGGGRRHILNLDHGMDRLAKVECFQQFVDAARFT
jgi:uroporphyrinogen decarboxylase